MRSPDEYAGRLLAPAHLPQEQAQRAGHIPTAANVPWSKAANDDGTFKSDDELKEIYTEAGVDWAKDTIAYCRIGERSSHTWFVLKELLGQQNVKNYDGSWTEYGSLVGVPVALGDEPGRSLMCGATEGGLSLDGVDVTKEAIVQGQVIRDGEPVGNAYVRLLDRTGEFTAEVPDLRDRSLPVLRRRRRVDAAHPRAEGRPGRQGGRAAVGSVAEVCRRHFLDRRNSRPGRRAGSVRGQDVAHGPTTAAARRGMPRHSPMTKVRCRAAGPGTRVVVTARGRLLSRHSPSDFRRRARRDRS